MSQNDRWQELVDAAAREGDGAGAPPRRSRWRAAALWSVLAAALVAMAAGWFLVSRAEGPDARALEAGRRLALSIAAEIIRDFVRQNGRYPEALGEAMPLPLELRYRRVEGGFELETTMPDGRTMVVRER